MKFEKTNENYNCTVCTIKTLIPLEGCDNVQGAIIDGYQVIVSKDTNIGNKGIFFPAEIQLSEQFCKENNLFRDSTLNKNTDKKGYIEGNRRVKTMKFRGHKSEGLWLPIEALSYTNINNFPKGQVFNSIIDGKIKYYICTKYTIKQNVQESRGKISRIIDDQFRFHIDTLQAKKNKHLLTENMEISITRKYHGTSWIVGNVLTKRKLSVIEKISKFFGAKVKDKHYDYVYSSRTVIKNKNFEDYKTGEGFYSVDVWNHVANKIKEVTLPQGITLYGEVVGFLPGSNSFIQKNFDYGCKETECAIIVYKMTYTSEEGKVYLVPFKQMVEFCKYRNLKTPDLFYYGQVKNLYKDIDYTSENWKEQWVEKLYLEKDFGMADVNCPICKNKVPSEGVVIRQEDSLEFSPTTLKAKNFRFLEKESKDLDKGEVDIESEQ